jgi:hypothetical protein
LKIGIANFGQEITSYSLLGAVRLPLLLC